MATVLRAQRVDDARQSGGRTLPQMLRDLAHRDGGRIAIRRKARGIWENHTWAGVHKRVSQLALGLSVNGLCRGDTIAMISENIAELFWLELAALAIGARVVCAYPDATAEELRYIVDHSGACFVVAEDQEQVDKAMTFIGLLPALRRLIYIDERGLWSYREPRLTSLARLFEAGESAFRDDAKAVDREIDAGGQDDVAVLCYTSGTTSAPKAAMLSHRFLLDNAFRIMAAHKVPPGAAYLSYISPAWATEQFFGFGLGLLAPLTVHFAEKPETVRADLREVGPEYLLFTPRQWEMMASDVAANIMDGAAWRRAVYRTSLAVARWSSEHPGSPFGLGARFVADRLVLRGVRDYLGLTKARAVLSGGAGLSAELFRLFQTLGIPLRNIYGSTELGVLSSHWHGTFDPRTMGEPLPSDPSIAQPIEAWLDERGQLCVKVCGFSGYLKNDAAAAELGDPVNGYRTGDAARLDERGQLIFLDRLKDLRALSTGATYPPQFIENQLRASPFVKEIIVVGDETRPAVTALVNIEPAIAGGFAERHGFAYGTFTELSQLPAIRTEISRVIAEANELLPEGARVRQFVNLPKELDADESELTRSRKLRRGNIEERYREIIEAMYANQQSCRTKVRVQYQDGRTSDLDVDVAVNLVEASR